MWAEVALPLSVPINFSYKVPADLSEKIQVGQQVKVPFRQFFLSGVVIELHTNSIPLLSANSLKEIYSIVSPTQVSPQLLQLMRWLSQEYACTLGEALSLVPLLTDLHSGGNISIVIPAKAGIQTSNFTGLDSGFRRNDDREDKKLENWNLPYTLTEEQDRAIDSIVGSIQRTENKNFLLYGVTSSGKTEVYLHAISEALRLGKQALFMVPEISICPPFLEVLRQRFGSQVGLWHSQVSVKEKREVLEKIETGEIKVVVGARSSLFLPLNELGIIVLDEEHDHSYKQQEKPRYHTRETALKLMEIYQGVVVMGSATPSIETFYRAQMGSFQLLELPRRVSSLSLPEVKLVDKKMAGPRDSSLSKELRERLTNVLWKKEQSILALNRRGFFTYLVCSQCNFVWKCSNCELALVLHKHEDGSVELECHYCFQKKKVPIQCASCGSHNLFSGGCGTQKIAQELKKAFPFARVLRLDKDTAKKKGVSRQTYETFKEEEADILVGTQMVTQGFHFPKVTLVGIIDADTALHHPDFRAAEKSYQWLSQAAGRSGRSDLGGEVIIQSSLTEHYVLKSILEKDYKTFYDREIQFRKQLSYPPFSRLVLLRVQGSKKMELVVSESERLKDWVRNKIKEGIDVLGPGPCPREHLRGRRRWQMLVKCKESKTVSILTKSALEFTPKSGIQVVVDVDPYDTL